MARAPAWSPLIARLSARRRRTSSASAPLERGAVIGLGLRLLTEQIVGKPTIAPEHRGRRAKLLGSSEIGQRRARFTLGDLDGAHSGLRQRAPRVHVVGAGEESGGGLGVAELERRAAGADQRLEILGIVGERADVAGERGGRRFIVRRIAALRRRSLQARGNGDSGARKQRPQHTNVQQSPHRPSPWDRESCRKLSA